MTNFSVRQGFLEPKESPRKGDLIEVQESTGRPSTPISIGENWRVNQGIEMFDTVCFTSYSGMLITFQVQPCGVFGYGKLMTVRVDKAGQTPSHAEGGLSSKRRAKVLN